MAFSRWYRATVRKACHIRALHRVFSISVQGSLLLSLSLLAKHGFAYGRSMTRLRLLAGSELKVTLLLNDLVWHLLHNSAATLPHFIVLQIWSWRLGCLRAVETLNSVARRSHGHFWFILAWKTLLARLNVSFATVGRQDRAIDSLGLLLRMHSYLK